MTPARKIFVYFILSILFVMPAISNVCYGEESIKISTENQSIKTYSNEKFHFIFSYPEWLFQDDGFIESSEGVTYKDDYSSPWSLAIWVRRTTLPDTERWLKAQAKMSYKSPEYESVYEKWRKNRKLLMPSFEVISQLNYGLENALYIVIEHVIIDHDGDRPIYGKQMSAITVANGLVYKIYFNHTTRMEEVINLSSEWLQVISEFRVQ